MDVLIKNMEMPKEGFIEILIHDDGTVQQTGQSYRIDGTDYYTPYVSEIPVMYKAMSVPPHGDLIERNTLDVIGYCGIPQGCEDTFDSGVMWLAERIDELPTIIPAEEGK